MAGAVDVVGHCSGPGCMLEFPRLLQYWLYVGAVEVEVVFVFDEIVRRCPSLVFTTT